MFKLVALFALIAIASAKPSAPYAAALPLEIELEPETKLEIIPETKFIAEPSHVEIKEPIITKVADIVETVPTAVSHQSSTIVHSQAHIVKPILTHGVRTHIAPIVNTYATPVVSAPIFAAPAPVFRSFAPAPIIKSFAPSPILRSFAPAPVFRTAPLLKSYVEPSLHYTAEFAPTLTKSVHFASEPVVAGLRETILKPKLETPIFTAPTISNEYGLPPVQTW